MSQNTGLWAFVTGKKVDKVPLVSLVLNWCFCDNVKSIWGFMSQNARLRAFATVIEVD